MTSQRMQKLIDSGLIGSLNTLHPTNDELLIDLYRVQHKIFDLTDIIAKNRIRERILLDELKLRAVDIDIEQPKALDRFYDEF